MERICQLRNEHADTELQDSQINGEVQRFFENVEVEVLIRTEALIDLVHEVGTEHHDNRAEEEEHQATGSDDVFIEHRQESGQFQIFEGFFGVADFASDFGSNPDAEHLLVTGCETAAFGDFCDRLNG